MCAQIDGNVSASGDRRQRPPPYIKIPDHGQNLMASSALIVVVRKGA
jgi:hypothetical protein